MALIHAEIEQTNNVVIAHVQESQLDANNAAELVEDFNQRMRNDGGVYFVVDMSQVQFVSSAVIGCFVEFIQDLASIRGRFALCDCRDEVAFLFKVTRLEAVFGLYDDVESAIEALKA